MTCPVCGGKTTVYAGSHDCDVVYRYRKCVDCKHSFPTIEIEMDLYDRVVKKDDTH